MNSVLILSAILLANLGFDDVMHTHTHTHYPGELIWILLKQETVSGSGISWAICKSAHCSRQITMPAPLHSVFYKPDALPTPNKEHQSSEGTSTEGFNDMMHSGL